MKKFLFALLPLLFVSTLVFAQDAPYTYHLNGTIVDRDFSGQHKDDINTAVAAYTKEAALQLSAIASGYGILVEDGYMIFNKKSNDKIVEFLKKPDSNLVVDVEAEIDEDFEKGDNILNITTIANKSKEMTE